MALLFGAVGLFTNPMLLFIAMFVWFGAGQEAAMARHQAAMSDWSYVRESDGTGGRQRVGPWIVYRDESSSRD